jgi:hypothetical protein
MNTCSKSSLALKKGFWRHSESSDKIIQCSLTSASCLGGTTAGVESWDVGYTGPLCAVCEDGYLQW